MSKTNISIIALVAIIVAGLAVANYYNSSTPEVQLDELTQCLQSCKDTYADQDSEVYQGCLTACGTSVGSLTE
ncbi:MAG: hypothetical protein AAB573_05160 [Patescibacteria group bacterium]